MLDTLLGICIEVRAEHQLKADGPIVVTDSGIVTEVRAVQSKKV